MRTAVLRTFPERVLDGLGLKFARALNVKTDELLCAVDDRPRYPLLASGSPTALADYNRRK